MIFIGNQNIDRGSEAKNRMITCQHSIRVMHARASNFLGGPEKQIIRHLSHLDPRVIRGSALTFAEDGTNNEFVQRLRQCKIPYLVLSQANIFDMGSLRAFVTTVNAGADILCVHGYKPAILAWLAKPWLSAKIVGFSRGRTEENLKVKMYQAMEMRAFRHFHTIVTVSFAERQRLARILPSRIPIHAVHNAISVNSHSKQFSESSIDLLRSTLGIPRHGRIIVAAGRLSPEKGQTYLIDAFASIAGKYDAYLCLCGDGPDRPRLEEQASASGVGHRIRFEGYCEDMQPYFRLMDCLVLPSLAEGLPNVILESLAERKPVVASDVGGVSELIRDNIDGILVPPADTQSIANAIGTVLGSPELSRRITQSGFDRVRRDFSVESQTTKMLDVYQSLSIDSN